MSLTIKKLNGDASFFLSFSPITDETASATTQDAAFNILLDPRDLESPNTPHSNDSSTSHASPAFMSSIGGLPEPDLIIIGHNRTDHGNEATLKQLPPANTKTIILAESGMAKNIRSWKYFEDNIVQTLETWEDPRKTGRDTVFRMTVASASFFEEPGEVTVSLIRQKRDLKGRHSAIGITYRPPSSRPMLARRPVFTPPATPKYSVPVMAAQLSSPRLGCAIPPELPMPSFTIEDLTPPSSPVTLSDRSVRSMTSASCYSNDRSMSLIFSPHGTAYSSLESFATSHLVQVPALPLTALLHSFDAVSPPWWLGGNGSTDRLIGQETALALGAKTWISTHNGESVPQGIVSKITKRRRYGPEQAREMMNAAEAGKNGRQFGPTGRPRKPVGPLDMFALQDGEDIVLTNEGLRDTKYTTDDFNYLVRTRTPVDALGLRQCVSVDGLKMS